MRVWVYPEKAYEEFGARRWEVEWFTVKPAALKRVQAAEAAGDYDEIDPDSDIVCHVRVFPLKAKGLAIALAKRMAVCDDSAYGSATVTEQAVDWYVEEDKIAEWTNIGEPEVLAVKRGYSRAFKPHGDTGKRYLLDDIPAGLWTAAREKAKRDGISMRALLLTLLAQWVTSPTKET